MPLAPILMCPAYRSGNATPWGGDSLRTLFGKQIPDERTGECLEVSAIPGLNSTDENGILLGDLIHQYGGKLVGTKVHGEFPLLLKLLDAKDQLSVQVHPDDAYAGAHEGKLGKSEAWVILSAKPGAQLVYGVKPGTNKDELRAASLQGSQVENLLHRVAVRPGEVYDIPSGMVHAIGAGIVLYEIQQSSDVTYRFYDFERRDAAGNLRPLHIEKALAVTDVDRQMQAAVPVALPNGGQRLIENPYFTLERYADSAVTLPADRRFFRILTALRETRIAWEGGELWLKAGQTALLPADGYPLSLEAGDCLLAHPT